MNKARQVLLETFKKRYEKLHLRTSEERLERKEQNEELLSMIKKQFPSIVKVVDSLVPKEVREVEFYGVYEMLKHDTYSGILMLQEDHVVIYCSREESEMNHFEYHTEYNHYNHLFELKQGKVVRAVDRTEAYLILDNYMEKRKRKEKRELARAKKLATYQTN